MYLHMYECSLIKPNSPIMLTSQAVQDIRMFDKLSMHQDAEDKAENWPENLIVHFECKLKQIHIKLLKTALSFFGSCHKMMAISMQMPKI